MTLPTCEDCFALMSKLGMPDHIRAHSVQVARVADALSHPLKHHIPSIDLDVIECAALLHDIGKAPSLITHEDHGSLGARLLIEHGYDELAPIVKGHIGLVSFDDGEPLSETLIVNYADKRVMHVDIVSLEVRFEDLRARYAPGDSGHELVAKMLAIYRRLEAEIFKHLDFTPEMLAGVVEESSGLR